MIKKNKVVTLDFTVRDDNGEVIDTTIGDEPLVYIHGADQLLDGLEAKLEGKNAGDKFLIRVTPEEGYGLRDEDLVQTVGFDTFDNVKKEELEPGMFFDAETEDGEVQVRILDVDMTNDAITVDGNHPLAGLPLSFDGVILDVRDATPEEMRGF